LKGVNPQNISFAEATRWLRFAYDKCFNRQDFPHLLRTFVILEDEVVTFLHIIQDHAHVTQFGSKWQLAHFYKTLTICWLWMTDFLNTCPFIAV